MNCRPKGGIAPFVRYYTMRDAWRIWPRFPWQALGNLNNGGNAGLRYLNANNGLGNANWNIGSRASDSISPHLIRAMLPAGTTGGNMPRSFE